MFPLIRRRLQREVMVAASIHSLQCTPLKHSLRTYQHCYTTFSPRVLWYAQRRDGSNSSCSSSGVNSCWKCGYEMLVNETLFCENDSCGVVQYRTAKDVDFLRLFDVTEDQIHKIDTKSVEKKFKNLQKVLHPDKFTLKSIEEQEASATTSSMINQAYQTIINPQLRLSYVLKRNGINILSEEGGTYEDADLMAEMFMIRSDIEDATQEAELDEIEGGIKIRSEENYILLSKLLADKENQTVDKIKSIAVLLKYLHKVIEEVDKRREELEAAL